LQLSGLYRTATLSFNSSGDQDCAGVLTDNYLVYPEFEDILQKCKEKGNINCALNYTIIEGRIFKEIAEAIYLQILLIPCYPWILHFRQTYPPAHFRSARN
jgi:hypothetical protein